MSGTHVRARRGGALLAALALAAGLLMSGAPAAQAVSCPAVGPTGTVTPAPVPGGTWAGCDLTGANLSGADLSHMTLTAAVLSGADLRGTTLALADLTGATGLGTALTSGATVWTAATCPDATRAWVHDLGSCAQAVDTTPPGIDLLPLPAAEISEYEDVHLHWTTPETAGSGVGQWQVRTRAGSSGALTIGPWRYSPWYEDTDPNEHWASASSGAHVCSQARLRDHAGNVGPWSVTRCTDTAMDDADPRVLIDSAWRGTLSAAGWIEQAYWTTTVRGATISTDPPLYVRHVGVVATVCPTCGSLDVYVGAQHVGRISLLSSRTVRRRALALPTGRLAHGRVVVVVSSRGRMVRVDGLVVSAS